ncbi:MAG: thiamine pyrophosphate-binding protein [Chloroflexi bacterium]|nr:thiamine pyrophosphate-binding protein [Chloroflexota bacterium]
MSRMSGARFIAETINGYRVTHVFFVPAIMWKTLVEMDKLGIQRVVTHSEKAAAYMADGYARASHRPGVCLAQSVGAANLASGLQDAYLGLSPVIALTGRRPPLQKYRHSYQEIDHMPLFQPVTKFNATVDRVEQLPLLLRQSFREATSGAPGPVHLDIQGVQGEVATEPETDLEIVVEHRFSTYPPFRPGPEPERIQEAVKLLLKSRRPVIVAGGGVTASQAGKEVVALAEKLSIPVATSLNGKGSILDTHPLAVGVVGSYSRQCANDVVSEADLVIFIGSHTGSQVTNDWKVPRTGTAVVQIDVDPAELGRNYPAHVALLGDARVTLQRLSESLPSRKRTEWTKQAGKLVAAWRAEMASSLTSDATPIRPERICKELTDFLPSDALLVSDTGHAAIWSGTLIDLKQPGQGYIRSAGSLGWGFPAALGAKCALPERPVICFTGDGGFWYHLAEMETAVRYGINTVTVINNNHSLNQCKKLAEDAHANQRGSSDELWRFHETDLARIARDMGCFGTRVTEPGRIRQALHAALRSGKPAVVEVVSDADILAPTPHH